MKADDIIERTEKEIVIQTKSGHTQDAFDSWKNTVADYIPNRLKKNHETPDLSGNDNHAIDETLSLKRVITILQGFNVESRTPMECMVCLSELRSIVTTMQPAT